MREETWVDTVLSVGQILLAIAAVAFVGGLFAGLAGLLVEWVRR